MRCETVMTSSSYQVTKLRSIRSYDL